jgi:hypothetical protein
MTTHSFQFQILVVFVGFSQLPFTDAPCCWCVVVLVVSGPSYQQQTPREKKKKGTKERGERKREKNVPLAAFPGSDEINLLNQLASQAQI